MEFWSQTFTNINYICVSVCVWMCLCNVGDYICKYTLYMYAYMHLCMLFFSFIWLEMVIAFLILMCHLGKQCLRCACSRVFLMLCQCLILIRANKVYLNLRERLTDGQEMFHCDFPAGCSYI